jgi:hypothetical protein
MRSTIANWSRLVLVVAVVAGTQTGCKSGWKMPGTDMFSWNKKPSEASLAGSNPTLSVPGSSSTGSGLSSSSTPVSPATRNTPNVLASSSKSSPYAAAPAGAPQYGAPTGSAATANGYQTGPYATVAGARPTAPGAPNGFTPPTGYANTQPMMGQPPAVAMSATAPQTNAFGVPPANAFGATPANGYGAPQAGAAKMASAPTYTPNPMQPQLPPSQSVPAMPVGMSSTNMAALPPAMAPASSMPNAVQGGFSSSQPVATNPTYAGAAPYRPGSTGRPTAYNFSGTGAQNNAAPAGSLPGTNVPHTANGLPPATNMYR